MPTDTQRAPSEAERERRRAACAALGVHPNTRWVTCGFHGRRGRVEDVYEMNNTVIDEGDGLRCDPTHPGCFDWWERDNAR